jgi:hypothetical protein
MPFQFYCPQGHLLEGHESQMGQQSQCPLCGAIFLIPQVPQPQAAAAAPAPPPPAPASPPAPAPAPAASAPPPPNVPAPSLEARIVRIPCPKGHLLETPSDMFGQQALCPYCNTQFELLYENSVEYQEEQVLAKQRREEEINKLWLKWTIRAAILVGVMFFGMFLYAMVIKPWLWPTPGMPTDAATAEPATTEMPAETPATPPAEKPEEK